MAKPYEGHYAVGLSYTIKQITTHASRSSKTYRTISCNIPLKTSMTHMLNARKHYYGTFPKITLLVNHEST